MVNFGFCNILRNGYLGRGRPKPQPKTMHVSHPETLPRNRKRQTTDQQTQVLTQIVLYYGKDLQSIFAHLGVLCRAVAHRLPLCAEICAHVPPTGSHVPRFAHMQPPTGSHVPRFAHIKGACAEVLRTCPLEVRNCSTHRGLNVMVFAVKLWSMKEDIPQNGFQPE